MGYTGEMTTTNPKRRWFQFSLRTLLVFVTLCAIPCSWLAVKVQQARREREAATAFRNLGGLAWYGEPLSVPTWLSHLLGDDFFAHVWYVDLYRTDVSDAKLKRLESLSKLRVLNLYDTKITDAGLENLKRLNQLESLDLDGTKITDAGLEYLKGMTRLHGVSFRRTRVTDAGVQKLKRALPNCEIIR
jgi:hypothetical protein